MVWQGLEQKSGKLFRSLGELVEGRFPQELSGLFTASVGGLFPSPREISFDCSCPDYAYMCKHVAAVLYGVGSRLDKDPSLFFTLRKIDVESLVSEAASKKSDVMLESAKTKSGRVIHDIDISDAFGIELASSPNENITAISENSNISSAYPPASVKIGETVPEKPKAGKMPSKKLLKSRKKISEKPLFDHFFFHEVAFFVFITGIINSDYFKSAFVNVKIMIAL